MKFFKIILCFLLCVSADASYRVNISRFAAEYGIYTDDQGRRFYKFAISDSNEILIPKDGRQPSVKDALIWSCANAKDDSVTNWFMYAFGLDDGNPSRYGFEKYRIFSFDQYINPENKKSFCDNFKKIAATSVGREALYRILIEISREDAQGYGCIEREQQWYTTGLHLKYARERLRHIVITDRHKDHPKPLDGNSFEMGTIRFCNSQNTMCTNAIDKYGKITQTPRTDDVGIFHELLHWLHALIDIKRFEQDLSQQLETSLISEVQLFSPMLYDHELAALWCSKDTKTQLVSFSPEEFRTIIGYLATATQTTQERYVYNGDHLSENLYRACVGQKIRYGHNKIDVHRDTDWLPYHLASKLITYYDNLISAVGYKKLTFCARMITKIKLFCVGG